MATAKLPLQHKAVARSIAASRVMYATEEKKAGRAKRAGNPLACALAGAIALLLLAVSADAHPSWGLVVDRQGRIYFGDVDSNSVWRTSPDGKVAQVVTGKHSHELFMDENGNLYGEHVYYDAANNKWIRSLWELTEQGQLKELLAPTADVPRGMGLLMDRLGNHYGFAISADGNQEYVLVKKAPDGSLVNLAGSQSGYADGKGSEARFKAVQAKVFGPDGAIYITDGSCVRRIAMDGQVTTPGGNPLGGIEQGEHPRLLGLTVDPSGNIYVADYEAHCIRRISADGSVTTAFESGPFWSPSGVALVGDSLYALEHRPESVTGFLMASTGPKARIRILEPGGKSRIAATLGSWTVVGVAGGTLLTAIAAAVLLRRTRKRAGQ
jgi:NHL repeat-containing protein